MATKWTPGGQLMVEWVENEWILMPELHCPHCGIGGVWVGPESNSYQVSDNLCLDCDTYFVMSVYRDIPARFYEVTAQLMLKEARSGA
jgi:hypothetical protein